MKSKDAYKSRSTGVTGGGERSAARHAIAIHCIAVLLIFVFQCAFFTQIGRTHSVPPYPTQTPTASAAPAAADAVKSISAEADNDVIRLPSTVYALQGQEINIYFDNIINGRDTDYSFDVMCSCGAQYGDFYRLVPDAASQQPITINIMRGGHIVGSVSSAILASGSDAGSGVNRKILIIGDSTTANGIAVTKLNQNFDTDVMDITCVGTRGDAPNCHEGRSGWTIHKFYTDAESPFVFDGAFDFTRYMQTNGFSDLDYVFINLGINDVFTLQDDDAVYKAIDTMLPVYQAMINSVHSYDSDIVIGVCLPIPPAYDQDAFGKQYACSYNRERYKRNNFLLCDALIDEFDHSKSEKVYLVPINVNLDTRYNMGLEDEAVNARNTMTRKSTIANGGVHPAESGYWQIADVYWYFLKSFEQE